MKKIIPLFTILILMTMFCSYSKSKEVSVQGFIKSYGNVPFNYPVIETEDGKSYSIKADDDVKDEIFKTVGEKIEVTGIITEPEKDTVDFQCAKDGYIEVIEWKIVEK